MRGILVILLSLSLLTGCSQSEKPTDVVENKVISKSISEYEINKQQSDKYTDAVLKLFLQYKLPKDIDKITDVPKCEYNLAGGYIEDEITQWVYGLSHVNQDNAVVGSRIDFALDNAYYDYTTKQKEFQVHDDGTYKHWYFDEYKIIFNKCFMSLDKEITTQFIRVVGSEDKVVDIKLEWISGKLEGVCTWLN